MRHLELLLKTALVFAVLNMDTLPLSAQTNQWTWVKGSNGTYQNNINGSVGVPNSNNTPGAKYHAVSWTDNNGNLWQFGGLGTGTINNSSLHSQLWKYDISTGNWTWMKGSSTPNQNGTYGIKGIPAASNTPGARWKSVSWTDMGGNLWLFGGYGYDATNIYALDLNDLWKYDINTGNWTWMSGSDTASRYGTYGSMGIADPANTPGARAYSTAWTDYSGNLWLFGGVGQAADTSGLLNDVWKYTVNTGNWTWMKGTNAGYQVSVYGTMGVADPANTPGGRIESNSWKDNSGNLWLFGGTFDNGFGSIGRYLNDLWRYDISSGNWTWIKGTSTPNQAGTYGSLGVSTGSNMPGSRVNSVSWKDLNGDYWLCGGTDYDVTGNSGFLNDLWKYSVNTGNWTWMKGNSLRDRYGTYGNVGTPAMNNTPGGRYGSIAWTDFSGDFWLFGGAGYAASAFGTMNDLWKFSPSSAILPLTFINFTVVTQTTKSVLSWDVAQEQNIATYDIERSSDGRKFIKIGSVASLGNTSGSRTYSFTDAQPLRGTNYYRIKIIEKDGKVSYSELRLLNFDAQISITMYPIPAKEQITLTGLEAGMRIRLLDAIGKVLHIQKAIGTSASLPLNNLAKGLYIVQVYNSSGTLLISTPLVKE